MEAFALQNWTLNLGPRRQLRGPTFHLRPGQSIGIFGPNGAGKSSFGKALLTGSQLFLAADQKQGARSPFFYLPSEVHSDFDLNVQDWLELLTPPEASHRIPAALTVWAKQSPRLRESAWTSQLSDGERQKLSLVIAELNPHPYLILDESFSHIDIFERLTVLTWIDHLKKAGRGLVIVSHDFHFLKAASDQIYLFPANGRPASPPISSQDITSAHFHEYFGKSPSTEFFA